MKKVRIMTLRKEKVIIGFKDNGKCTIIYMYVLSSDYLYICADNQGKGNDNRQNSKHTDGQGQGSNNSDRQC